MTLLRVGEHHRDVLRVAERTVPPSVPARPWRTGRDLPERAEEHVRDRAVHRPAHDQRQQGARRADEHAGDDQDVVLEHEAGRGRGETGEGVQERDHDRHVGAADREHEEHAEEGGAREEGPHQPLLLGTRSDGDSRCEGSSEDESIHQLRPG